MPQSLLRTIPWVAKKDSCLISKNYEHSMQKGARLEELQNNTMLFSNHPQEQKHSSSVL